MNNRIGPIVKQVRKVAKHELHYFKCSAIKFTIWADTSVHLHLLKSSMLPFTMLCLSTPVTVCTLNIATVIINDSGDIRRRYSSSLVKPNLRLYKYNLIS